MKNQLKNRIYNIKININNNIDELNVSGHYLVSELRQMILDKYLLSPFNYSIFYKNKKLTMNNFQKLSSLFNEDYNPFLFIVNNTIFLPNLETDRNSINIVSNSNEKNISDLI